MIQKNVSPEEMQQYLNIARQNAKQVGTAHIVINFSNYLIIRRAAVRVSQFSKQYEG